MVTVKNDSEHSIYSILLAVITEEVKLLIIPKVLHVPEVCETVHMTDQKMR